MYTRIRKEIFRERREKRHNIPGFGSGASVAGLSVCANLALDAAHDYVHDTAM